MLPALAAAAMLVPAAVPAVAAQSPASTDTVDLTLVQVDEDVIADSLRMRRELGFEATESKLAAILNTKAASTTSADVGTQALVNEWGFIGTAVEAAEMERRDALISAVEPTVQKFAQQDNYGGHFLDNKNGGRLVVQFAGTLPPKETQDTLAAETVASGSSTDDVEFRVVQRSSAELTDAMEAVWAWATAADNAELPVVAVEEDVAANRLKVVLRPGTAPDGVRSVLNRLNVPADITEGDGGDEACSSRNKCDSPRRGGVGISKSGGLCSIGWVVNRNGKRGAVTAGHCWRGTNSGAVKSGSGTYGSLTSTNALKAGTHADMRFISIPSNSKAWLYQNASNKARVVKKSSLGSIGSTSCLFGRNSEKPRCGTISSTNASHTSSTCNCVVYGQSAASYSSDGGDSGGAVASSTKGDVARGVHAGAYGGKKHYSDIGYTSTYNMGKLATG
ncbi:hypothetical protein [Streptomyces sp. NPDC057623]|uniref:hypothetical protein n=1 Tax=Streptomyces sp. NPDC057623 TaxID=3346187 RepID=UPI0036959E77